MILIRIGVWLFLLLAFTPGYISASPITPSSLLGTNVSASLQPLNISAGVITQFVSPQIVVDPGVEFTGGLFTPNAALQPLAIQLINSFAIDLDVFASSFRITISHVPGSITGFESLTPGLRVVLSDLHPSDGAIISGIGQTAGLTQPITSAFVSSASSVSVDFKSFGVPLQELPNIYEFQLQTQAVPEPSTLVLFAIGIVGCLFLLRQLAVKIIDPHIFFPCDYLASRDFCPAPRCGLRALVLLQI
jgi:hypothetical protein